MSSTVVALLREFRGLKVTPGVPSRRRTCVCANSMKYSWLRWRAFVWRVHADVRGHVTGLDQVSLDDDRAAVFSAVVDTERELIASEGASLCSVCLRSEGGEVRHVLDVPHLR
jgi:hypothetical protein